jgi:hypothetical protein
LIVAHTTTFLTELAPFGRLVRERTAAETIFYCPFLDWSIEKFANECAREGVICLLPPLHESLGRNGLRPGESRSAPISFPARLRRLASRVARGIAARLPGIGSSFVAEWLELGAGTEEINRLLSAVQPDLLVLGGDMAGYNTSLYVKLAHERGIRVLIVPSTMSDGTEQAEVYYGNPAHHVNGIIGRLMAVLFPKWVRMHNGTRLFRCPPGRILAMELAGLAPPQPWIFNSGYADAVAIESQAMIDYYLAAGMKDHKMVLTGSLSDDALATRLASARPLREKLCGELGFDPDAALLVTALPPDFFYLPGGRPQCDFSTYDELVEFWIESLAGLKGCNCVVALHPSIDATTMRHIERDNVRIGTWRTAEMVPACDAYVASISSTIRWAIASAKPVVNYDVYRYRYKDFEKVPGVLATEAQAEFRDILQRLVGDAGYRQSVAEAQRSVAAHWGRLDGSAGERILALTRQLSGIAATASRSGDGISAVRAAHVTEI